MYGTAGPSAAFLAMADSNFKHVTIMTEQNGRLVSVASIDEAVDFLLRHWPEKKHQSFDIAHKACLDVLEGRHSAESARAAFIAAAKEANIYVVGPLDSKN